MIMKPPAYGKEQRRQQRRSGQERREMIRFDLTKTPRRSGKERREVSQDSWQTTQPL